MKAGDFPHGTLCGLVMKPGTSVTSPDLFSSFGDLLKYLRRRAHLTQLEFSIIVGYSESQISRLEKNLRLPDPTAIKALFIPALHLEDEPELAEQLLELAQSARQEDAPVPGAPPYKGLLFFDEADSEWFFGREALTARLAEHLMDLAMDASTRLLAVVGASGSGKSSLVRAGLAGALRRAGWQVGVFTPGRSPVKAMEGNLKLTTREHAERVLLVVDQFEELFTLCGNEIDRIAFIEKLLSFARDRSKRISVVLALRADFYSHCAQYPLLRQAVAAEQEYIGQMSFGEMRRAIEEPARRGGWEFEPGLLDVLLTDIGAHSTGEPEPGALPLLSHALLATWERRRGRVLTLDGYRASGGVRGAIAETAESVFTDRLDLAQQEIAHDVFMRLTELGEGTEDTRRRAGLNELVQQSEQAPQLRAVLDTLAEARLIVLNEDSAEVAHEALIREWQRLHEWLTQDREALVLHRHLTTATHEWEARERDPSELYRGARLAQAREWAAANDERLNAPERAFLAASIEQEGRDAVEREAQRQRELEAAQKIAEAEKQRAEVESQRAEEQIRAASQLRKRALYLAGAFVIALFMALAALFFSAQSRRAAATEQMQRLIATSRELAAASISNLEVDPERSILLALEAMNAAYTVEAEDALHRAVQTSRVQLVVPAHEPDAPMNISISPDGKRVATSSPDELLKVWDATTGEHLLTMEGHYAVYSPDGKQIASVVADGTVRLWDAGTGEELPLPNQVDATIGVAYSPDGSRIATITSGLLPKVWDARTGEELVAFAGHTDFVPFAYFGPDGTRLLTISDDGSARVWNAYTGEELLSLSRHLGTAPNASFSPDGRRIATVGGENGDDVYIWDAEAGEKLLTLVGHTDFILGVSFSPDGTRLATAGTDGKAIVWDAIAGTALFALAGHSSSVWEAKFSPDGTHLATTSDDGTWRLWDLSPSREMFTFFTRTESSGQLAFSADGKLLATTEESGTVKIRDALSGAELQSLPSSDWIYDLAFHPSGKQIAIPNDDRKVSIWDVATGNVLETLSGHTSVVTGLAFNKDGTRLVTAGADYKINIWDTSTLLSAGASKTPPKLLLTIGHPSPVRAAAFDPEGNRLATGIDNGSAIVWNPNMGKPVLDLLRIHRLSVNAIVFSPDGSRIATASRDGTAKIWDATSGSELFTLRGHIRDLQSIAYSPDGKRIATASLDGTARLWDADSGLELLTFFGDGSGLSDVAFSPDGTRLATGGYKGIRVYVLPIDELIALAQTRVTRDLTSEECQKYLHGDPSACAPAIALPTTTLFPPTDQGRGCQVTDTNQSGLNDNFFNELIYKGLQDTHEIYGWDAKVLQSASNSDVDRNLAEFLRGDCDLIIGTANISDALLAAAQADPNQEFLLPDVPFDEPMENVWTQLYATDQASFLAGYAAASVTRTGKVAVFGGVDSLPVTDFMDGFVLGVQYYNEQNGKKIEVLGWDVERREGLFVGGFCCAAEGRAITEQLLDEGADIILPVAGAAVGSGALFAVKSHGSAYIIGVDTDWAVSEPTYADIILTSVMKNFDVSVIRAVKAIEEGTFAGGVHMGTLETGEVGLAPFHQFDRLISDVVKAKLEQIKEKIISGEIKTKP
jgi:WD40 repeat protein/basic membrane lipoprotein Med (substrate-binding protein (PBP1-ABC) superfamily)/transcriptional regulator with XRE-family HTH domain